MAKVMEILRKDHRNMRRLLDILEGQLEIIRAENIPDGELLDEVVNYCLTYPDLYHHPKEDQVYRRLIRQGVSSDQIGDMETAHLELKGLTIRLARALKEAHQKKRYDKVLASLIESFVDGYRLHIESEELTFFPLAEERLSESDWREIDALLTRLNDPLFGDAKNGSFRHLSDILM